jgi:outer membrane receptor protein involved in Fe transport
MDYELDSDRFGAFSVRLGATRLASLETQINQAAPSVEYAGVGSAANVGSAADGGGLKWQANAALTWNHRNLTLGWVTRYFDSYFLNAEHVVDGNQNAATVPSQQYHDLFGSYNFSAFGERVGFLSGVELQFGVNNVFNKAPPVDLVGGSGVASGGYSYFGDPRLANYYLSLKMNFGGR